MNKLLLCAFLSFPIALVSAQKYVTMQSKVTFFSDGAIEDIAAENKKTSGIVDMATSQLAFSVSIIDFKFEKKLMEEHFNEKYMESEKYPKATFQGQLTNWNIKVKGEQNVLAKGKLTVHGVTNEVEIPELSK